MPHRARMLLFSLLAAPLFLAGAVALGAAVQPANGVDVTVLADPNCPAGTHWDKVLQQCVPN